MKRNVTNSSSSGSARVASGTAARGCRTPTERPARDRRGCSALRAYERRDRQRHDQRRGEARRACDRAGERCPATTPTAAPTEDATHDHEHDPGPAQPAAHRRCGRRRRSRAARAARNHTSASAERRRSGCRLIRPARISRARSTSSCIWARPASSTDSKRDHAAQPLDERHLDLDAVELEVVAVQHVALHPALALAVERRVGADADRGRVASRRCRGAAATRRTRRRRARGQPRRSARWRSGSPSSRPRWSPRTTTPADGERAAERLGGAGDVAGGQAGADVRRRPHLRAAVERRRPRRRSPCVAPASRSVATSPAARLPNRKLAPTTTAAACSALDEHPLDELLGASSRPCRGRTAAPARASTPASPSSSARASMVVSVDGACSGRSTAIGCGSKVTATTVEAAARRRPRGPAPARAGGRGARRRSCRSTTTVRAEVGRDLVEGAPDLHGGAAY